jgi:hypothetical protein
LLWKGAPLGRAAIVGKVAAINDRP